MSDSSGYGISFDFSTGQNDNDSRLMDLDQKFDNILCAVEKTISTSYKEWMNMYDTCHKLCTGQDRHEEGLYGHAAATLKNHVHTRLQKLANKKGEDLLKQYRDLFGVYRTSSKSVAKIAHTLARFWIVAQKGAKKDVKELGPLSLLIWRENLYVKIKTDLWNAISKFILADRDGAQKDKSLIREIAESVVLLGVGDEQKYYEAEFENAYIEETKEYYVKEAAGFIAANPIEAYMTRAVNRINEERNNCQTYYGQYPETLPKLENAMNYAWIDHHMEKLQACFEGLLKQDKVDHMTRFYFLLSRVKGGLDTSAKTFEKYVAEVGLAIVKQQVARDPKSAIKMAISFTDKLISHYEKYESLVNDKFKKDVLFRTALDEAMKKIMNAKAGKFTLSRILNFYIDKLLQNVKKLSEEEIMNKTDSVVSIFTYFRDKDEFLEYAKRSLCKRLLSTEQNFLEGPEQHFLSRLKEKQGAAYTNKLTGMFRDCQDDKIEEMKEKFRNWSKTDKIGGVAFSVQVLNEGHWPINADDKFPVTSLPAPLAKCQGDFEKFYKEDTASSKKLRWLWGFGTVTIGHVKKVRNASKKLEIIVTPLQACVLSLFNEEEKLTFAQIRDRIWPSAAETTKYNKVLVDALEVMTPSGKTYRCLKKDPPQYLKGANPIADDHVFTVDVQLGKRRNFKFNKPTARKTVNEDPQVRKELIRQREFEMDAAIVRVMKARNVCTFQELQAETINILKNRFKPNMSMFKKRIESLIEREYVSRAEDFKESKKFIYMP